MHPLKPAAKYRDKNRGCITPTLLEEGTDHLHCHSAVFDLRIFDVHYLRFPMLEPMLGLPISLQPHIPSLQGSLTYLHCPAEALIRQKEAAVYLLSWKHASMGQLLASNGLRVGLASLWKKMMLLHWSGRQIFVDCLFELNEFYDSSERIQGIAKYQTSHLP